MDSALSTKDTVNQNVGLPMGKVEVKRLKKDGILKDEPPYIWRHKNYHPGLRI